ncbi:hypothetical protein HK102_001997 [Quaeritorhiza haematococci]|nr:hypothetical protein HK102_001997 [Quaeritorhiza haematococci]
MDKRRAHAPHDGEPDAKKPRIDADGGASAPGVPGGLPSADQVKAMIEQKRRELAAKMEALKKQNVLPSAPPTAASASSSRAAPIVPSAPTASSVAGGLNQSELQRKIEEAKRRIKESMAGNSLQAFAQKAKDTLSPSQNQPADKTKRGLAIEYHPALVAMQEAAAKGTQAKLKALVPKAGFATVKANQRVAQKAVKKELKVEKVSADFADPTKNPYFDPSLKSKTATAPKARASRGFQFVRAGKYVEQANQLRAKAHLEKLKQEIADSVRRTGMDQETMLASDQAVRKEPPPAVEWWDAQLLPNGTYDDFDEGKVVLDEENMIVTKLVQHPVPILPPAEPGMPAPKPLMLTKKERKKLRRQRRLEAQKEKQDKVRLGLLPPDQPKVKISNLMRVLGSEAVQDPTKIEAQVRAQMEARQLAAKKHNAEKKLTEEQRKEKKRKKLLGEDPSAADVVQVAVFRINDLSNGQHRFKVDMNAQQYGLSGAAIIYQGMNVVIVEGTPKGIKAYKKLMLRRIDWTGTRKKDEDDEADVGDSSQGASGSGDQKENQCLLVWEGEVKERLFRGFRFRPCPTELKVKELLEKAGALHFWDMAKNLPTQEIV